jgi:UPF0755 protein
MKKRSLVLWLLVVAIAIGIYALFFRPNGELPKSEVVIGIPKGASASLVADSLAAHDLIRSKLTFELAARLLGMSKKLHAGGYRIAHGLTNAQIISRLTGTEYLLVLEATFPEGITMYRAASIAHAKLKLDSVLFIQFATDTALIHELGVPREAKSAEGYLFPDTYQFMLTADPKSLVTLMIKRWKRIVKDSLYAHSDKARPLHSLMALASIVEGEARVPAERDTIAGVYANRLKIGMKLDADPTVQYGLHLTRPITHDDLLIESPYNTYLNAGLPPGPINSPGAASVRAALAPARHSFLYFVARRDGSGGHYFSRTLDEQSERIAQARRNAGSLVP